MRALVGVAVGVLLAGCAGGPVPAHSPDPIPTASAPKPSASERFQTAPPLPQPSGQPVDLPRDRLDAIRSDLRDQGINTDSLRIISAETVTWNDGAWGCPAPGRIYSQAVEQGYAVVVDVAGAKYDYRFGSGPTPKLCPPLGER